MGNERGRTRGLRLRVVLRNHRDTEAQRRSIKRSFSRVSLPLCLCGYVAIALCLTGPLHAQRGGRGATTQAARQAAPFDLTGYWVSVINEDWKFRMVPPRKGVFETLPLNGEGRKVGESWDPARDEASGEQCRAYGAPNIMRLPGRLHITW